MTIHGILAELNESNSTLHKIAVLKKHADNDLLKRVLKMTYDKVVHTYGVTVPQIEKFTPRPLDMAVGLEFALDFLQYTIGHREVTGHEALQQTSNAIGALSPDDADLLRKVITRDLRVNIGRTQINKVWKDLIVKPAYMRCGVYGPKTSKNIKFPAVVQLKADGTYREFSVMGGLVESRSRSGESYEYPVLFETLGSYPDGIYTGELTVRGETDRAKGNGMINSDDPPHEDILLDLWDYISHEEYELARRKDRKNPCTTGYGVRLTAVRSIIFDNKEMGGKNVRLIRTHLVDSIAEALKVTSDYMSKGFEGTILKDLSGVFKDGTSKHQLKLKLEIDAEVRIVGFQAGTVGTKREGKIGSIIFENDERTIRGRASGFSDKQMLEFTATQDSLLGKIMTVQFNDLTQADGNDYWALSHPRFIEVRDDKDSTDTLERVQALRDMAMELSQ